MTDDVAAQRRRIDRIGSSSRSSQRQPSARPAPRASAPAARTAQRSANPTTAPRQLAQSPVLEKADPATRAAFLKLMGANWIWSPAHTKDDVPVGDCYFRKTFTAQQVELAQVHVACDNQYELYVNGRLAGRGADWRHMDVHDVTKLVKPGQNVVAIKATNTDAGAAGLVARVLVKEKGGTFESYSTDASWRTSVKEFANWTQPNVRDADWLAAKVYGPLGGVLPWGDEIVIADEGSRFLIDPEFAIERLLTDEQAGSLIAMAFSANGDILASQENGPLLLVRDANGDGVWEMVQPFCSDVKNVQGILSLGNQVFAVGDGPNGGALYRITDENSDGRSDRISPLVRFRGAVGEHGPHTVRLGTDGLLYLLSGNFVQPDAQIDPRSPYGPVYEGDLIQPRYEDPNGHAAGIPAPGGRITRTDMSGSFVEVVAAGLRNPYDFAFNGDGEIFTYDADMEWDIGAPWYRPTRLLHVPHGGEFGWRSGWAKWPEYYLDSLPAALNFGPGSPTGLVFYDHVMFPVRLQNTLFIGDWAAGQIHAVKLERNGATFKAKYSTFIKGRPLNVTALDVGPDGALYFCTGGRGTDGGIYRVRWTGNVPPQTVHHGIDQALRQPQLHSDWGRKRIAAVKRSLGDRWQTELQRVLADRAAPAKDRARAIELLALFGPPPTPEMIVGLSRDADPAVRVRAARLMGAKEDAAYSEPLAKLLGDSDAWVRRVACEAVAHRVSVVRGPADPAQVPVKGLIALLDDSDRFVAYSARRVLEKIPAAEWQEQVLAAATSRMFLQGATGLLIAHPSPQIAERVLSRCDQMLRGSVNDPGQPRGQISDATFLDLLRVVQLAFERGPVQPNAAPSLTEQLVREYPTRNALMNRELVKLFAYLQPPQAPQLLAKQLETGISDVEKLHIAAYAARITVGWQTAEKLTMLRYFEQARGVEGGHSLKGYLENFARDFFTNLTLAERRQVLAAAETFPTSALSVLAKLPENPGADVLAEIRGLDQKLGEPGASATGGEASATGGESIARLRVGIVAVLGRSGEPESLNYLRNIYLQDPQRRAPVAMSLTQHPGGESWPILVDSLRTMEGEPAKEVLAALAKVDRRPETSEPYRNAILQGLRLNTGGGQLAVRLLEHWLGERPTAYPADAPLNQQLAAWQRWYSETFPNELPAELPKELQPNKWSYEELASFLESPEGKSGSPARGAQVFTDAQCINCHRYNGRGEGIGPDLTTVAQRFQRKEILESIVYPNQVVSDQYASQIVTAGGRTYTGIAARHADGSLTILQQDSTKVQVAAEDIEDVQPSKVSAMPEGSLNKLTLEQVADLFAFLTGAAEPNIAARNPAAQR
jgi:putative heme-binding domain-containing protein